MKTILNTLTVVAATVFMMSWSVLEQDAWTGFWMLFISGVFLAARSAAYNKKQMRTERR